MQNLTLERYNKMLDYKTSSPFINNNESNSFYRNKNNVDNFIKFLSLSKQLDRIPDLVNNLVSPVSLVLNYLKPLIDKEPFPLLIDDTHHISQIAKCMYENIKNKKMNDICSNNLFKDFSIRHCIAECKFADELLEFLQKDKYPIFLGHFLERCIRDIMFVEENDTETLINNALASTDNELKKHDSPEDFMQAFLQFSQDVHKQKDFFESYFKEYLIPTCEILKEKFPQDYKDKIDFSHFGIFGEGDYMFGDVLVDSKCYQVVNDEKLKMFLFQLLGYYVNNKYLSVFDKTRPSITKFLIIDPIEDRCKNFSYYYVDISEFEEELEELCQFYLEFCKICF